MKKLILLASMITVWLCAEAQVKRTIKKGNRNKAESQFTLDKGYFQAEWEVGYETVTSSLSTLVYPNLALRYGITDRFEINTEMNLLSAYDHSVSPYVKTSGIEPVYIGLSYELLQETVKRPSIIFTAQLAFPYLASKSFTASYYAPVFLVMVQQPVKVHTVLGISSGVFWDGFSKNPSLIYNASYTYNFVKHWIFTAEFFGFVNHNSPLRSANISLAYALKKQLQFGFTAGVGLSSAAYKSYFAINGVWGFNTIRNKKIM